MSLTRIYVHAVWAVKFRAAHIERAWRGELCKFIDGAIRSRGHTSLITNSQEDHLHTLFRFSARESISSLLQHLKGESSRLINQEFHRSERAFRWQGGYGAFSVNHREVQSVYDYVLNQDAIHARRRLRFLDEYDRMSQHDGSFGDDRTHWFEPLI